MFDNEWIDAGDGARVLCRPLTGPQFQRLAMTQMQMPNGNFALDPDVSYAVFEAIAVDWSDLQNLRGEVVPGRRRIPAEELHAIVQRLKPAHVSRVVRTAMGNAVMTEEERGNSSRPQTSSGTADTSTAAAASAPPTASSPEASATS